MLRQVKHVVMTGNSTQILTIPRANPVNAYTMGGNTVPVYRQGIHIDVARL